jgi:ribosomal protein S18 acetylase RimI-like enzyme
MITGPAQKNQVKDIARIHQQELSEGFLGTLGLPFLETFYQALMESPDGFCLAATENGRVIGFVTGVTDLNAFYRYFLRHYFFSSLRFLLPRFFNVSVIARVMEILRYPGKQSNLPNAELVTIAVSGQFQGKGAGRELMVACVAEMKKRKVASFKLVVGESLKRAIVFYEKSGFNFIKLITVHGHAISRVYVREVD